MPLFNLPFLNKVDPQLPDGVTRPTWVVLENVPGFAGSRAFALLERTAEQAGYTTFAHGLRCPTELGVPGVRRRFYAVLGPRAAAVAPSGHEISAHKILPRQPAPSRDARQDPDCAHGPRDG